MQVALHVPERDSSDVGVGPPVKRKTTVVSEGGPKSSRDELRLVSVSMREHDVRGPT